ncbi:MAG: hypothetical protein HC922_02875 [Leptolyngbyaceae cyanobacterium SM2_3_12]|nr:hypothetical protein [Leptolyngbyaceae cyanobacterium SM2_3_12]
MTGFIRGLFKGKPKNPGESDRPVRAQKAAPQPTIQPSGGSYYLNPDDAKSFGDIDYMRSVKTVRRTYAKKRGETGEKESIRQISAMDSKKLQENGLPSPQANPSETTFQPAAKKTSPSFDRRKTDTNLDMFRQMAKDMKK